VRLRISRLQAFAAEKYKRDLPEASQRALTLDEVNALTCNRIWLARNEIYYALGRCFVSEHAENIFHTRSECPSTCKMIAKYNELTDEVVSKVEIDNITMLTTHEKKLGCVALISSCSR